jgi:endonuclease-3 related protein
MVGNRQLEFNAASIRRLYKVLLKYYGPQGWWPLRSRRIGSGGNITGSFGFSSGGYHPGINYELSGSDIFEIAAGAILTQNTSWNNAASALDQLISRNLLSCEKIQKTEFDELAELIKSSGYYNQKAAKLKTIAGFLLDNPEPSRDELLSLNGIGPETADVIMLYAFNKPHFIVDTYTRRIFSRVSGLDDITNASYKNLQKAIEDVFYGDFCNYQEYHALLVIHAKKFCLKDSKCTACPAGSICNKIK